MHRTEGTNYIVSDGKNQFTEGPPATTVPAAWLNSVQEEIANVVTGAGLTLKSAGTDTAKNQMWQALQSFFTTYDFVVSTQSGFNSIIERVAANQYKIKDEYKSVFIKNVTGGFACQGPLSFLSGGDSYGYIETNNCSTLTFEAGAYFGVGDTAFYLKANTEDGRITNGNIKGIGSVAASISYSFLIDANNITFDRCKTSNRKTDVTFSAFRGSATASHNITSQYNGCQVSDIEGVAANIYGFYRCKNISHPYVSTLSSTAIIYGLNECTMVSNAYISTISSTSAIVSGIYNSSFITNSEVNNISTTTGAVYGFYICNNLSTNKVETLDSTNSAVYGFKTCNQITACSAEDIDSTGNAVYGYESCNQVSACYAYDIQTTANTVAAGFDSCKQVTGCEAKQIDASNAGGGTAYGFNSCDRVGGCHADDIDANGGNVSGFNAVQMISSCRSDNIASASGTAWGFSNCSYGSSLFTSEPVNAGNMRIDTDDAAIAAKYSCVGTVWT